MHAEGMLVALVSAYAGDGDYFVTPPSGKKRRRVSGDLLVPASLDGPSALFRGDGRIGGAGHCAGEERRGAGVLGRGQLDFGKLNAGFLCYAWLGLSFEPLTAVIVVKLVSGDHVACFLSGLAVGPIWTLMPHFHSKTDLATRPIICMRVLFRLVRAFV